MNLVKHLRSPYRCAWESDRPLPAVARECSAVHPVQGVSRGNSDRDARQPRPALSGAASTAATHGPEARAACVSGGRRAGRAQHATSERSTARPDAPFDCGGTRPQVGGMKSIPSLGSSPPSRGVMWSEFRQTCCAARVSLSNSTELRTPHNTCDAIRNFRTENGACRLAPVPSVPASFPRPSRTKAPSLRRHYPASSVLRASPPPCRPELALTGFGWRVRATDGASRVASTPLRVHAVASTPAETTGHSRSRPLAVPVAGSLPRDSGGSASALTVSRPARRSLALRPARSLSRPRRPFFTEVLQSMSLPPRTAPIATGWNEQLAGRGCCMSH